MSLGTHSTAWWAALIVIALTAINIVGLRVSVRTQNVLTAIEVTGLVAVVLAGVVAPSTVHFDPPPFATSVELGKLGGAMIFVLLTYGGWSEAAYIARELKGRRAIVDALLASLAIIAVGYLGVNAALLNGLGFAGLSESKTPAADLMARAFGQAGANALAVFVAIATSARAAITQSDAIGRRSSISAAGTFCAQRQSSPICCRQRLRLRSSHLARCSSTASRRWSISRHPCSGHSCFWSESRYSCYVRAIRLPCGLSSSRSTR